MPIISISGPSLTGKSSLHRELLSATQGNSSVRFYGNFHESVWEELVSQKVFSEFDELQNDTEYLCIYLFRIISRFEEFFSKNYEDKLIILDGCWLDTLIYASLNMWYNSFLRELQEEIFTKISSFHESVDRIYLTSAFDDVYPPQLKGNRKFVSNFKKNRSLEIKSYELAGKLQGIKKLPSSSIEDSVQFILSDLKDSGYMNF